MVEWGSEVSLRWSLAVVLLVGCGGDKGDSGAEQEEAFSTETVLRSEDFGSCTQDVYWPAGLFPLVVDRFDPPAPPYEITEIRAVLYEATVGFDSRACAADAGLHVVVWLADGDALDAPIKANGTIDVAPLAEGMVTGTPSGEDGAYTRGTLVLDPPVRVEQAGALWIGMDAKGDAGSGPGACLGGCASGGDGIWRGDATSKTWADGDGSLALFEIEVAHD